MQDPRSPAGGSAPSLSFDADPTDKGHHDQADLAGFKDGFAVTQAEEVETEEPLETVRLVVKCPSLPDHHFAESSIVPVSPNSNVAQLKQKIERTWKGRPRPDGMRLFKSGQLLADDVIISSIVGSTTDADEPIPVHLVIRPGAWTEPQAVAAASQTRRTSGKGVVANASGFTPSLERISGLPKFDNGLPGLPTSHAHLRAQDVHLASVIDAMNPAQYITFLSMLSWVYASYVDRYEAVWKQAYGAAFEQAVNEHPSTPLFDAEEIARQRGCTSADVLETVSSIQQDVLAWESIDDELKGKQSEMRYTYEEVRVDGLPYLLRVERNGQEELLRALLRRMEKLRDIMHQMEKLINYQSLLDRTMVPPQHIVDAAQAGEQGLGRANVVRIRPSTLQTVLRRLSLLQGADVADIVMQFTFLAVKMGIMVYVFTRGASNVKTGMIAGVACLYVTFEAYKMTQRRLQMRLRAIRQALGVNGEQQAGNGPAQGVPMARQTSQTPRGSRSNNENEAVSAPQSPVQYRIASPLLLEFWIERIALWNLAAEDEEIGFTPAVGRSSRQRQTQRQDAQHNAVTKAVNDYVLLPIVLFLATLVPAIEQKRRRTIDLRDDLIRSTARHYEDQQRRLQESNTNKDSSPPGQVRVDTADGPPQLLQSTYAQEILRRRTEGRQIDIGAELDAAAAERDGEGGMDQVDMGFI